MFILEKENRFRQAVFNLVENFWFKLVSIILIVVAAIDLALESPLDDPSGDKKKTLVAIDVITTFVFTVEIVVKVIAYGFAFAGKNSFIR